jgi:hypothetical protein
MRTLVFFPPVAFSFALCLACDTHILHGVVRATDGDASSSDDGSNDSSATDGSVDDSGARVDGGPPPSVMISFPLNGITVGSAMGAVSISFETSNFVLVPPGDPSCIDSENCGHVHLLVDGSACSPAGQPYNNDGQSSPIDAMLTYCPSVGGSHTAVVELHHNDHSPVIVDGSVASASVTFTAI